MICSLETHSPELKKEFETIILDYAEKYGDKDLVECLMRRSFLSQKGEEPKKDVCALGYILQYAPVSIPLWNSFQGGKRYNALPYEGGYFDQPNIVLESFNIFQHEMDIDEAKRAKKRGR